MKIEKERMVIEDTMDRLMESEKGITCGCENPSLRMELHIDGKEMYTTQYACACGNRIIVCTMRKGGSNE